MVSLLVQSQSQDSGGPPAAIAPAPQRRLACLLDWQLWYWGQDIHHPAGNQLLAYGFARVRGPADGTQRSTAYVLSAGGERACHGLSRLIAWGFGVSATHATATADEGSALLVRHERSPGLCFAPLDPQAGTRSFLPPRVLPRNPQEQRSLCLTLSGMARCFADYERWMREHDGGAHRREAHQRRPRAVRRKAEQPWFLDAGWIELAGHLEADQPAQRAAS